MFPRQVHAILGEPLAVEWMGNEAEQYDLHSFPADGALAVVLFSRGDFTVVEKSWRPQAAISNFELVWRWLFG